MDYSSRVDTSLDLNVSSSMNNDMQIDFMQLGNKSHEEEESSALVEELKRASAENKRLTETLSVACENYNALKGQLDVYLSKNPEKGLSPSKKRKSQGSNNNINGVGSESSSSDEESYKKLKDNATKTKISKAYVRTDLSDKSLIVKDEYQWRKYGQKVTRDNPYPRAYFKCSFAPTCPVKKKVQRSIEDHSVVVATYEGEHNHPLPSQMDVKSTSENGMAFGAGSSGPTISYDLTKSKPSQNASTSSSMPRSNSSELQKLLVEQMASSLSKDPNFTAALAAAISGKIQRSNGNW